MWGGVRPGSHREEGAVVGKQLIWPGSEAGESSWGSCHWRRAVGAGRSPVLPFRCPGWQGWGEEPAGGLRRP